MNPLTETQDTIVALGSGQLPSGIAIVRISGPRCSQVCVDVAGKLPEPRKAMFATFTDTETELPLDSGLVLWFPGHGSVTGEDYLEFHVHGGRAVVSAMLDNLIRFDGVRLADAGEFSKRGFLNGKMDLTSLEGLSDLLMAETEAQRIQAHRQACGGLRKKYENWRERLVRIRAFLEAEFDFTDEEDVPSGIGDKGFEDLVNLTREISEHLGKSKVGEIIREGYRIAIMGPPNAGKSTLLNAIAKRDVAIVSEMPGTTRDVLEVHLDLNGYKVLMSDTAGIRASENEVEIEGIARAHEKAREAQLVLWVTEMGSEHPAPGDVSSKCIEVVSKDDDGNYDGGLSISARTGFGMDGLISHMADLLSDRLGGDEDAIVTRERHRVALRSCHEDLVSVLDGKSMEKEIIAEHLRSAGDSLGRIIGRIDVEDLLDVIFSEFCVGK